MLKFSRILIAMQMYYVPTMMSCSSSSRSSVKIQDSTTDTTNYYAGVVPVQHGREYCSGSFLTPMIYITAQHCVDRNQFHCGVTVQGVEPDSCLVDWQYVPGVYTVENAFHDVAILLFRHEKKFPIPRASLLTFGLNSSSWARSHDDLTLVGFGGRILNTNSGGGPIGSGHGVGVAGQNGQIPERGFCRNRLSDVDQDASSRTYGLIHLSDNTSRCLPTSGDSGGPLVWYDASLRKNYIVGMASTVFYPELGEHVAVYVAAYAGNTLTLIEQAAAWMADDIGEPQ